MYFKLKFDDFYLVNMFLLLINRYYLNTIFEYEFQKVKHNRSGRFFIY
jgi:hypothetical protein